MNFQYLTGSQAAITTVMRTIGFRYYYDARNGQFAHDAGFVLLTPGGRVAQYFFGVRFAPEALRLALVNASNGRIGNIVDHFLLLCCDYDAATGRYSVTIQRILQWLGTATALAVVALVGLLLRRESRRRGAAS
jgi:protein SCO1/2